jgi:hypothetical protein
MVRLVLAVLAATLWAASLAQAAGTVYRDPAGRFEVEVPEGWTTEIANSPQRGLLIRAPRTGTEIVGLCSILARDFQPLQGKTQAQVEQELARVYTPEFWARFSSRYSGDATMQVESSGSFPHKGRTAHYGVLLLTPREGSTTPPRRLKMVFQGLPGVLHSASCGAPAATYASYEPHFDAIYASHEPKAGLTASLPRVPSTALLNVRRLSADGLAALMTREQLDALDRMLAPAKGRKAKAGSERPVAGTLYRDPAGRFEVEVPQGWTTEPVDGGQRGLRISAPRTSTEIVGMCGIAARDFPQLQGMTQAQVDEELTKIYTPEFWEKIGSIRTPDGSSIQIESSGNYRQKGRTLHYGVLLVTLNDGTATEPRRLKMVFQGLPGVMHGVTCGAPLSTYASYEAQFDSVYASYEPKAGLTASLPRVPSTALLNVRQLGADGLAALMAREQVDALLPAKTRQAKAGSARTVAGTIYRDPAGHYEVEVPDGWTTEVEGGVEREVTLRAPKEGDDVGGMCSIAATDSPEFVGLTQSQVDAEMAKIYTPEFWADIGSSRSKDYSTRLESSGSVTQKGRAVHYAVLLISAAKENSVGPVRLKMVYLGVPGVLHGVVCASRAATYASYEPQFESIFASYEPKAGLTASLPRASGTAALNARQLSAGKRAALVVREQVDAVGRYLLPTQTRQLKAGRDKALAGTVYQDPLGRFAVTVPDGWTSQMGDGVQAIMVLRPDGAPQFGGGGCFIAIKEVPELKGKTQAEVDAELEKELTPEVWNAAVSAPSVQNAKLESSGTVNYNGRKAFYGVATATANVNGQTVALKAKLVYFGVPGSLHAVGCSAKADIFETQLPIYDGVFASYEPKRGEMIVSAPPAGAGSQAAARPALSVKSAVASIASALLAGRTNTLAAGTDYNDPHGFFSVVIPEGWNSQQGRQSGLFMTSPVVGGSRGVCWIMMYDQDFFRTMSPAEIDDFLERIMTPDYWKSKADPDEVVQSSGVVDHKGRKAFFVVIDRRLNDAGVAVTARMKTMYHGRRPGTLVVKCMSFVDAYARWEPTFESVFSSIEAKDGAVVMTVPPAGSAPVALSTGDKKRTFDPRRAWLQEQRKALRELAVEKK